MSFKLSQLMFAILYHLAPGSLLPNTFLITSLIYDGKAPGYLGVSRAAELPTCMPVFVESKPCSRRTSSTEVTFTFLYEKRTLSPSCHVITTLIKS